MTQPPNVGMALLNQFDGAVELDSPLAAERQLSWILGQVWAGVEGDREEGVAYFCSTVAEQLKPAGAKARPLLELLARLAPPQVDEMIADQASRTLGAVPGWVGLLDSVELIQVITATAPDAMQENVLLEFGYRSGSDFVGRHIVVLLLDYGRRIVKDAYLVDETATMPLLRAAMSAEPGLQIHDDTDPRDLHKRLIRLATYTAMLPDVSELGEELIGTWWLLEARMKCLVAQQPKALSARARSQRVSSFLKSEAGLALRSDQGLKLTQARRLTRAIVDYENDISDGRWNAGAVEAFFMGWAPDEDWGGLEQHLGDTLAAYLEWGGEDPSLGPDIERWHAEFLVEGSADF